MKPTYLLILSMFSLFSTYAESPVQEEFLSSLSTEPTEPTEPRFAEEDNLSLEEKLSLLDEEINDFEEEVLSMEEPVSTHEVKSIETTQSDVPLPAIDLSLPMNGEENLSLEIIEEKSDRQTVQALEVVPTAIPPEAALVAEERVNEPTESHESHESIAILNIESTSSDIDPNLDVQLDLKRAFAGSPLIYTLLTGMSVFSVFIWLYSILSLKKTAHVPQHLIGTLESNLNGNQFDEALNLCSAHDALLCKMVASGIQARKYGLNAMIESMKAEGKRSSISFWQKIGLLNDVAILAPMLGLLGTVIGMFYAFYDVNRSIESITSLFDGLGISVGTTVAGLAVAILALILHSTAKYRLIRVLSQVESEAHRVASLIDNHTSLYTSESK